MISSLSLHTRLLHIPLPFPILSAFSKEVLMRPQMICISSQTFTTCIRAALLQVSPSTDTSLIHFFTSIYKYFGVVSLNLAYNTGRIFTMSAQQFLSNCFCHSSRLVILSQQFLITIYIIIQSITAAVRHSSFRQGHICLS